MPRAKKWYISHATPRTVSARSLVCALISLRTYSGVSHVSVSSAVFFLFLAFHLDQ